MLNENLETNLKNIRGILNMLNSEQHHQDSIPMVRPIDFDNERIIVQQMNSHKAKIPKLLKIIIKNNHVCKDGIPYVMPSV